MSYDKVFESLKNQKPNFDKDNTAAQIWLYINEVGCKPYCIMTVGGLLIDDLKYHNWKPLVDFDSKPRDLPADAQLILATLNTPFRIISHLSLVHDTAPVILEAIQTHSTALIIDADVFLFGAAIHDIGKPFIPMMWQVLVAFTSSMGLCCCSSTGWRLK